MLFGSPSYCLPPPAAATAFSASRFASLPYAIVKTRIAPDSVVPRSFAITAATFAADLLSSPSVRTTTALMCFGSACACR
jgi:hypothetical protein